MAKTIKNLKHRADRIWSLIIRTRDGKCVICGNKDHLNAHHIFTKGAHGNMRWNLDNGITLCQAHHIFGVHIDPALYMPKIEAYVGSKVWKALEKEAHQKAVPVRIVDLEEIIERLENEIKRYGVEHE